MSNPVVLITGALTGIGRATALAFAQEGARIVVSGRRDEAGQALVTELRALGAAAHAVSAFVGVNGSGRACQTTAAHPVRELEPGRAQTPHLPAAGAVAQVRLSRPSAPQPRGGRDAASR